MRTGRREGPGSDDDAACRPGRACRWAVLSEDVPVLVGARVALVHDWFQGYHGAERTVETIRAALAARGCRPDIFTFHAARELLPPELDRAIVKDAWLASLPGIRQRGFEPGRWRWLLPYMPLFFGRLDLDRYDLVLSSSHSCALGVQARADATHVCYCHTPMRYAWMSEAEREGGLEALALSALRPWLRWVDRRASRRPDHLIANSRAVQGRIARYWGRSSEIIHPPVELRDLRPRGPAVPGRFLWVHRLVGYKRPELAIEAFRGLPHHLTMVGVGPLEARVRATLPRNVELRGWVSRAELTRLYAEASGFLHLGEEDFGITMVEALGSGTPVIALDQGGARDIVRDGLDGILIPTPEVEHVRAALREVMQGGFDPPALAARAEQFSSTRFEDRLMAYLAGLERSAS